MFSGLEVPGWYPIWKFYDSASQCQLPCQRDIFTNHQLMFDICVGTNVVKLANS